MPGELFARVRPVSKREIGIAFQNEVIGGNGGQFDLRMREERKQPNGEEMR